MERFIEICKKSQKKLRKYCRKQLLDLGYEVNAEKGFLYAPGDIPVLLVAHMDTVHDEQCKTVCVSKDGIIMSPEGIGGDDRCGVYMILEIVKELKCHVLFTEDEEVGGVGAKEFARSKYPKDVDVNYIIEFDRTGYNDSVYYWLDNPKFEEFISSFGHFETQFGSYSDICDVAPAIGVAAVNLSCGYFNAHEQHEYVDFYAMLENIDEAKEIIKTETEAFEWSEGWSYYSRPSVKYLYDDSGFYGEYTTDYDRYSSLKYKHVVEVDKQNVFCHGEDYSEAEYFVVDKDLNVYEVDLYEECCYWLPDYFVENVVYDEFNEMLLPCYI